MDTLARYLDPAVFLVLGMMSFIALAAVIECCLDYRQTDPGCFENLECLPIDVNRGLTTIATIASNAPYVGLFGTVLGIMFTFHEMGRSGVVETGAVMLGFSLARKATALGLVVAIPSMMAYNGVVARTETLLSSWRIAQQSGRARSCRSTPASTSFLLSTSCSSCWPWC